MNSREISMSNDSMAQKIKNACNLRTINIFKEKKVQVAFKELYRLLDEGYNGLCLSRTPPNLNRPHFNFEKSLVLRLTRNKLPYDGTLAPNEISRLASIIIRFIDQNGNETGEAAAINRVILLDNIYYLSTSNLQGRC
jgi:hypothetical protein